MRRLWLGLAALTMVAGVTGCADGSEDGSTDTSPAAAESSVAQPDPEGPATMPGQHITVDSGVEETVTRIKDFLAANDLTLFAEVDHRANALTVGQDMPETVVLSFGNAAAGTPLMLDDPDIAYELPLRVAVFESADGTTVYYRAPSELAERYDLSEDSVARLEKMDGLYERLTGSLNGDS